MIDALTELLVRAEAGLDQSATHEGLENCEAISAARAALANVQPMGKLKDSEHLSIYSMRKRFDVTAIFGNDDDANAYLAKPHVKDQGVIATIQGVVFIAEFYGKAAT